MCVNVNCCKVKQNLKKREKMKTWVGDDKTLQCRKLREVMRLMGGFFSGLC